MANCRSVPSEAWEHARQALIFYFSRRHGIQNAEDLAHETLIAIWNRPDFEFAHESDFPKICYGFASRILKKGFRETAKFASQELDAQAAAPEIRLQGLKPNEMNVFLHEVFARGAAELREDDWELIRRSITADPSEIAVDAGLGTANNVRVRLFRARQKLSRITGWRP